MTMHKMPIPARVLWIATAAAVALAIALLLMRGARRGAGAVSQGAGEQPAAYDRMKDPEYLAILESEKKAKAAALGELAAATRALEDAKADGAAPETLAPLEAAVAAKQDAVELERQRALANLRQRLWREENPGAYNASEKRAEDVRACRAVLAEAERALAEARAVGAAADELEGRESAVAAARERLAALLKPAAAQAQ